MYNEIIYDFFGGLFNSFKINLFVKELLKNSKLLKLVSKIFFYNFIFYFLPTIFLNIIYYIFGITLFRIMPVINVIITIISDVFHMLHYIDLINIISKNISKNDSNVMPPLELVSLSIIMTIYQIVIYLVVEIINITFNQKIWFISSILNFIILTIYHSFYCYNNLWHYKKIEMHHRIIMHEKLWPYYIGYGTIAALIYQNMDHHFIVFIYNIYLVLIIFLPFFIEPKYPSEKKNYPNYPSINLKIFSYITSKIFLLSKYLINIIKYAI